MGFLQNILNKLSKKDVKRTSIEPISVYLPKTSSIESKIIQPRFPYEYLLELERLIITNPDLAHAHQVFLDLANTDIKIKADDKIREAVLSFFDELQIEKLKTQLFNQIILYGAISVEWIVKEDLSGIENVKRVPVWTIRFVYNEENDKFEPYQYLPPEQPIKLNEYTYQYIPLLTLDGSPYGIPPFVSVFTVSGIQEELFDEIANMTTKTGMIGFIDIEAKAPQKVAGETDTEYYKRVRQWLSEEAAAIQEMIQKGLVLHTDAAKVNYKEIPSSSIGKDITELIEQWMVSSAKMQPSLLGRTTGSTETWAYIAYEQFVRQLRNIQQVVEDCLNFGAKLHLLLNGIDGDVKIEFTKPPVLSPEKDANAQKLRAEKLKALVEAEIITKDEARRELGLDPDEVTVE